MDALAGPRGIEPRLLVLETRALPLDDVPELVRGVGVEPTSARWKRAALPRRPALHLVRTPGLEPGSLRWHRRATAHIPRPQNWMRERESNPLSSVLQTAALPSGPHALLAGKDGLEPPTRRASTCRSTPELLPEFGSHRRTRTCRITVNSRASAPGAVDGNELAPPQRFERRPPQSECGILPIRRRGKDCFRRLRRADAP